MLVRDYIVIGILILMMVVWLVFKLQRSAQVKGLMTRKLGYRWTRYLKRNVVLYRDLPSRYYEKIHGYMNVFLHDKKFVGCEGLLITDEIRLTIAAQASILLLYGDNEVYPEFHSIMVYPSAYYVTEDVNVGGGLMSTSKSLRVGESWQSGIVVLAWDEVLNNAQGESPGHNVVIHEFAHRLDQQNSDIEGVPLLDSAALYERWARILGAEFDALVDKLEQGEETVIDSYGATSPAEFFAVVSEMYFAAPKLLVENHLPLYLQLDEFYQLDPVRW
ncbi:hypothetical protein MNBD_GAMMA12-1187 [hydrothermal vent metagenome]|uniref:Inner membrane protein n=1 Tax=hydrothermal vent metagenome TaxID=652676 RepID=A0A3B0YNN1_9ZZZZ